MPVTSLLARRRQGQVRGTEFRRRFGLPASAVLPLFGEMSAGRASVVFSPQGAGVDAIPHALVVYEPGMSGPRRLLARLGTSRTVAIGLGSRPVSLKALFFVGAGAVGGTILAQPFDPVTFLAPLYGLVVGGVGAGVGWSALRGRGTTTIAVDHWRGRLDAICAILENADRIGQPFVSPAALRSALHSALWHAADAVGQPGEVDVMEAFDEQLTALHAAIEATLLELDSPTIAARKAAVTEHLAAVVEELEALPPASPGAIAVGDDQR